MTASTPIRIQRRRVKGWRKPANTACVDRSTHWGNPFEVVKGWARQPDGTKVRVWCVPRDDQRVWYFDTYEKAAAVAVECYRKTLTEEHKATFRAVLRGRNLACYCRLDMPCHADVLLELRLQRVDDLARANPAARDPWGVAHVGSYERGIAATDPAVVLLATRSPTA